MDHTPANDTTPTGCGNSSVCCPPYAPTSAFFLNHLPTSSVVLVVFMLLLTLATLVLYIEEIVFITKTFRIALRRKKTIWVLAFYPVFSICSFIGIIVPKSGPFVHMCANLYFCTCLYHIMRLIVHYMGGMKHIWVLVEKTRRLQLNTLPICCCCCCCKEPLFDRANMVKVMVLVMQVAIIRPIVLFISAVLWMDSFRAAKADEVFVTGEMNPSKSFVWLLIINFTSTMTAVYGLMILSKVLEPELQEEFVVRGKIASIQIALILTVIPNLIIGALVSSGVIACNPLLPAKAVGEQIYFSFIILLMLPFSLLGRKFFRRLSDGFAYATSIHGDPKTEVQSVMTSPNNGGVTSAAAEEKRREVEQGGSLLNGNTSEKVDLNRSAKSTCGGVKSGIPESDV